MLLTTSLSITAALALNGPAEAAESPAPTPWQVEAFVDTAYPLNFNFPENHVYRATATTPRTNEFTLPAAGLRVSKELSTQSPWWFEFGLHAGSAVSALSSSESTIPDADLRFAGPTAFRHLARANGGFRLRSGTAIGAGLFSSPIGIGGFWSKDNWNYTPSWESNAAAFYLSGMRVSQELPEGFSLDLWVVNGWQTMADANAAPSYLVALNWAPSSRWFLSQQVYSGPEGESIDPKAWRVLSDTQLTRQWERLGLAAVWDLGRDGPDPLSGAPRALWTGGAVFARYRVVDRGPHQLFVAARPELWWDPDGRMFGVSQRLSSATATVDWWFHDAILTRLEYRFDHSNADGGFFYRGALDATGDNPTAGTQQTLFLVLTAMLRGPLGGG